MMNPLAEKTSVENVEFLEHKLASNSASPLFARLASIYLDESRIEEALTLCEKGVVGYPEYSTGHLILGRCYLQLERFHEAKTELVKVLELQPRCSAARDLLHEMKVSERAAAAKAQQKDYEMEAVTEARELRLPTSAEEDIFLTESFAGNRTTSDIATPTLAEIYASQGAFREAIRTYQVLVGRKPQEKERFEGRIRELKEMWRSTAPPG